MKRRTSVPEIIALLIFLEVVSFMTIDGIFAFGLVSSFQTEIKQIEFIYLKGGDCAGCDTATLDSLAKSISQLPAVRVMEIDASDARVAQRGNVVTYPSLSAPYGQYLNRADVRRAVEQALLADDKNLVGGVAFGAYAVILPVPFTFPYEQCGGDKVVIDYFYGNDQFSDANNKTIEMLRDAFGDKIELRMRDVSDPFGKDYEVFASPSYVFNCKYKKIGSLAASKGAEVEFSTVAKIVCALMRDKAAICS